MKVYWAEFRPKDFKTAPFFWKIVLKICGTHYHTGIVIGHRYFEMGPKGYCELPFESFEQLNHDRGLMANPPDVIDFVEIPYDFTDEQISTGINWWVKQARRGLGFGYTRFIELAFAGIFRKLSTWYFNVTGYELPFATTWFEKRIRVCSIAADVCTKTMGFDAFKNIDEYITVPGMSAHYYPVIWRYVDPPVLK
jgi:hypothetical protein